MALLIGCGLGLLVGAILALVLVLKMLGTDHDAIARFLWTRYLPLALGCGGIGGPIGSAIVKVAVTAQLALAPFFVGYYLVLAVCVAIPALIFVKRILDQRKWAAIIADDRAIFFAIFYLRQPIAIVAKQYGIPEPQLRALVARRLAKGTGAVGSARRLGLGTGGDDPSRS